MTPPSADEPEALVGVPSPDAVSWGDDSSAARAQVEENERWRRLDRRTRALNIAVTAKAQGVEAGETVEIAGRYDDFLLGVNEQRPAPAPKDIRGRAAEI